MKTKAAAFLVASLMVACNAWGSPADEDAPAPGMLPPVTAAPGAAHVGPDVQPLVTPSATIFVSTPDCTPAYEMTFPNLIGGLQAGSSLAFVTGGTARIPLYSRSAYAISDNESPRPQDRLFFNFNYFNDVTGGPKSLDINRETFGVEKALFDGQASIGLRVPLVQTSRNLSTEFGDDLGDMSIILKYAFLNDRATGTVLSGGLVVTVPTGQSIRTIDGDIHPTLLQPYAGAALGLGDRGYVEGFSSLIISTNEHDTTLWDSTLSLGYFLYRNEGGGCLHYLVPAFETQVAIPLNHRDADAVIQYPDVVGLTAAMHVGLFHRSNLTVGASTNVVGPRPFDLGAVAQFNMRF
jgi:hypothetical protein